jgi:hydrogenase maturation protease
MRRAVSSTGKRAEPRRPAPLKSPARARRVPADGRKGGRILVMGIGNPGREDDGLGPALAARIEALGLAGVDADANYQLNIEDAEACSRYAIVVFADAARNLRTPFRFSKLEPSAASPAMTHALGPGAVLALCAKLYGRRPDARLLALRGHRWGVEEGLSAGASRDLEAALAFLADFLRRA